MSKSILSPLVAQWFAEYHRLAYWLARRWTKRLLDYRSRSISANELEELAQDAIARGFDRFAKRCARDVCGASDRKRWVCQCVIKGARDAVRCKSRFGSITSRVAVRDDVMNRCQRVDTGFAHGRGKPGTQHFCASTQAAVALVWHTVEEARIMLGELSGLRWLIGMQ